MIGKIISHYKILEKLGSGGMGVVYKAMDEKLKRVVSLKFLAPEWTRDPDAKRRFIQEAQAASILDHPNICNIHEIDESMEEQLFIAMAYYEGFTIKELIKQGSLRSSQIVNISMQLAQGLAKAHKNNIVHRDIKPANIILTPENIIKILDFGLAKLGHTGMTKAGTTLGTIAYMSPEQARGEEVDNRTDIWSFGVVLYEMLTGELPFKGDYDQAVIYSILNESPSRLKNVLQEVSKGLEGIVSKCLHKNPSKRFKNLEELIIEFGRLKDEKETVTYFTNKTSTDKKRTSKYRKASLAFVFIVSISGIVYFSFEYNWFSANSSQEEPKPKKTMYHSKLIDELAQIVDVNKLRIKLNEHAQSLRIAVGKREDFEPPDGCFVFVFSDKQVFGVFKYMDNIYFSLNSDEKYTNLVEEFSGENFAWVKDYSKSN